VRGGTALVGISLAAIVSLLVGFGNAAEKGFAALGGSKKGLSDVMSSV